jgi:hypothetical protein
MLQDSREKKEGNVNITGQEESFHWSQQHSFQFEPSEHNRSLNRKTYKHLKRLVMSSNIQLGDSKGNRFQTSTAMKFQSPVLACVV